MCQSNSSNIELRYNYIFQSHNIYNFPSIPAFLYERRTSSKNVTPGRDNLFSPGWFDSDDFYVILKLRMKTFRKFIALILLAGFGVSFATVDAHSAGFCDDTTQVVEKASSDELPSDAPVSSADCHCQSSANCQFDGAVMSFVLPAIQSSAQNAMALVELNSISLDGLKRPPRA